jgi:hypothetical protein
MAKRDVIDILEDIAGGQPPNTYTIPYLRDNGSTDLPNDSDPNDVDPGEPGGANAVFAFGPVLASYVGVIGQATGSLTVVPWIYDHVRETWF